MREQKNWEDKSAKNPYHDNTTKGSLTFQKETFRTGKCWSSHNNDNNELLIIMIIITKQ